jgi:hypothetical protein
MAGVEEDGTGEQQESGVLVEAQQRRYGQAVGRQLTSIETTRLRSASSISFTG